MAATIAEATGIDKNGRVKETHRLGSRASKVRAATWNTSITAYVNADGSGHILVSRYGEVIHQHAFGPETEGEDR